MVTMKTEHGEYTGSSVAEIVRREYGSKAEARISSEPGEDAYGRIIERNEQGVWRGLAVVYSVEEA
ncbi:hypothetical protein AB0G00_24040 [Nocardia salmonicida]|uniref:hypothetical protein n=1 Tax=Nocardia salmonicida TaxID=53431 RepID=UPI0033F98B07